jgi:hypothetical protein
MKNWNHFIIPLWNKITSLASNKKLLLIICGCIAGLLLLVSLLAIFLHMNHNQEERLRASQALHQILAPKTIKEEELFLPEEPDFLPKVILDREPRDTWTDEDAEQFWADPLQENDDEWKNRIFKAVDDIMETIP